MLAIMDWFHETQTGYNKPNRIARPSPGTTALICRAGQPLPRHSVPRAIGTHERNTRNKIGNERNNRNKIAITYYGTIRDIQKKHTRISNLKLSLGVNEVVVRDVKGFWLAQNEVKRKITAFYNH